MESKPERSVVGRGANSNPASRFENIVFEEDLSDLDSDDVELSRREPTQYIADSSNSVVSENNSPDLNFRFSINPYRGCAHGCSYCYARVYHEFLGMSAGLDFETKIIYKPNAAELFRDWLNKQREVWPINFSGATDCYQPVEREFNSLDSASKWPSLLTIRSPSSLRTRLSCETSIFLSNSVNST